MSLGSRILNRGRAALTANLASTPREPLLFLYPQWIRKFSTSTEAASSRHSRRTVSPLQPNISRYPLSPSSVYVTDEETSLEQRFDFSTLHQRSNPNGTATTTNHSVQAILEPTTDLNNISQGQQLDNWDTSVVERKLRKVTSAARALQNAKTANRRTRKAYQAFRREQLRTWLPDWRVILADLNKHTPQQGKWLDNVLELVVPPESLPHLLRGIDDYILDIGYRYGCSIDLGSRDEDTQQYRCFIISGPAIAISKTTADVLRIAPDLEMKLTPSLIPSGTDDPALVGTSSEANSVAIMKSNKKRATIRNVVAVPGTKILKIQPGKIPRPKKWDHVSFLDYIRTLTASSVPNHLNRFGFKMVQAHHMAVTEIIWSLFKDPECKWAISRTACNEVMEYFVKINRIEDVRVIFVYLEMLNLPMVPDTFNIMLRGAAKSEDLHNFHFILHLMLRRGFSPNGETWLAFMSANPDIRVKLHILTAMKEKGLTSHPSIMKGVCQQVVGPEIELALQQNLGQDEFVAHMDSRYGEFWLGRDSANRILHSLGARGLISRCWEFLHLMESRFIKPDNYSFNTILHHCKQATNLNGAVELLRSLSSKMSFVPDQETYRILFELAWRTRSYNLARVIWRYACLSAETSFRMRSRIFQSMLYSRGQDFRATPRERWNQFAGPVICGANRNGKHPVQQVASTELNGNTRQFESTFDDANHEDHESSGDLSEVMDMKVRDVETAGVAAVEPEGKLGTSEIQIAEMEGVEDTKIQIEENEDTGTQFLAGQSIPEECQDHFRPNNNSENSPIRTVLFDNFWERIALELQQTLDLDHEVYKDWQPVKPFSKMLVEALERDTKWRKEGHYAEMDMHSLIRDAISVLITSKRSKIYGGIGEYEWK
jgi:pentatricopeptide repeat protein